MNRKKGIVPSASVEFIQVVIKNIKKQKRQKWERMKLQLSQETFKLPFYSGREVHLKVMLGSFQDHCKFLLW